MLIVSDLQEIAYVAENIDSLYDTITHDLGLDEWQQDQLVKELIYQFGGADYEMGTLENDNDELKEKMDEMKVDKELTDDENIELKDKITDLKDEIFKLNQEAIKLNNKIDDLEDAKESKEAAYKAKLDKIKAILDLDDEELIDNEKTVEVEEKQAASVEESQDHVAATSEENNLSTPWCANVGKFSKMLADLKLMMVNAYKDHGKVIEENDPMLKTREFMPYATVVIKSGNTIVSERSYRTVAMAKHTIKQTKARFKNSGQSVSYSLKLDDILQWFISHRDN